MSIDLLHRLERICLFLIIIFLPITGLPQRFALPIVGKTMSMYFLIASVLLLIYEFFKYGIQINKILLDTLLYIFCGKFCAWF